MRRRRKVVSVTENIIRIRPYAGTEYDCVYEYPTRLGGVQRNPSNTTVDGIRPSRPCPPTLDVRGTYITMYVAT